MTREFQYNELTSADLIVDAVYKKGKAKDLSTEVISKLLPVGNVGGFRHVGPIAKPTLVVLTSNEAIGAWPDYLDAEIGLVSYFGDNQKSGDIHHPKGNQILRNTFGRHRESSQSREDLPPFFYFTNWGNSGDWQFRGLLVPGGNNIHQDDELVAIWRTDKSGSRFQNYRTVFTVLDIPVISRAWIQDIISGHVLSTNTPKNYSSWIQKGSYLPLISPKVKKSRDKKQQLPENKKDLRLITHLYSRFKDDPFDFEPVALELWKLICRERVTGQITRRSADGGRDAIGDMAIGPSSDPLGLRFFLEAKCYEPNHAVGVKELSRLISRIIRHHFGVLITTSYLSPQGYEELRNDEHPIVIISGVDIVQILKQRGIATPDQIDAWLHSLPKRSN